MAANRGVRGWRLYAVPRSKIEDPRGVYFSFSVRINVDRQADNSSGW